MRVILPRQFEAHQLFPFIKANFGKFESIPAEINFDLSQLSFVWPSGIVFLSNLSHFLHRCGCRVTYGGTRNNTAAVRFLDDSLFFQQHTGSKLNSHCSPRSTTQPLVQIKHANAHGWIELTLIPWLAKCSGVPISELAEFSTCVKEIFNNIRDHTEFDVGCVFAQWYPNVNRLMIAVADFGAGIPKTVRRVAPHLTDDQAILKAFDDGFSSRSTPQNRGAGLFYLRQNVVENLGGSLTVRSLEGAVGFRKSGNSFTTVPYSTQGYCPGTLIEVEIRTDRLEFEPFQGGNFEW